MIPLYTIAVPKTKKARKKRPNEYSRYSTRHSFPAEMWRAEAEMCLLRED